MPLLKYTWFQSTLVEYQKLRNHNDHIDTATSLLASQTMSPLLPPPPHPPTYPPRGEKTKIGKTPVVKKNLNPTWDTTFDAFDVPYGAKGDDSVTLVFEIYDEDKASADDAMGIVKIPLSFKDTETEAVWYEVPYNSTKDASGEIQVKIKTTLVASS